MPNKFLDVLIGRTIPSREAHKERLTIPLGLAVLSSDVISSAAYATDELLLILLIGGSAALGYAIPLSAAIVLLLAVLVISYRQVIRAYPNGGGSYTVAKENLGKYAGLVAASGLLIDYILTVSVSISAGVEALTSAFPNFAPVRIELGLIFLFILMIGNLRGIRESGRLFALPTLFFVGSIFVLLIAGLVKFAMGQTVSAAQMLPNDFFSSVSLFLVLRAFSSGCAALTGTEAISNGVKIFKAPEQENARKTMLFMGIILGVLFLGITFLARIYGVLPSTQQTVISQIAHQIFGNGPLYFVIQFSTLLILIVAANTSFADFPRVAALLGKDRYLPNQLSDIGSRLVYSNGIIALAILSGVLLVVFQGHTSHLIPLYAVGVFISFTLSQTGMVIHWFREKNKHWLRSAIINGIGAVFTGLTLIVIAATKFTHGAWLVILLVPLCLIVFSWIHKHYETIASGLSLKNIHRNSISPTPDNHIAIVPISGVHQACLKALDYAKGISNDVRAVYVDCDSSVSANEIREKWVTYVPDIPLVILTSPERDGVGPILSYLHEIQNGGDRFLTVVIPEFVSGNWWTRLLHRQMASKLKNILLYRSHVPVVSVAYYLPYTNGETQNHKKP